MTPTQTISFQIIALMGSGADLRTAFDAVLGEGAYDKMASEIWEELRSRGQ